MSPPAFLLLVLVVAGLPQECVPIHSGWTTDDVRHWAAAELNLPDAAAALAASGVDGAALLALVSRGERHGVKATHAALAEAGIRNSLSRAKIIGAVHREADAGGAVPVPGGAGAAREASPSFVAVLARMLKGAGQLAIVLGGLAVVAVVWSLGQLVYDCCGGGSASLRSRKIAAQSSALCGMAQCVVACVVVGVLYNIVLGGSGGIVSTLVGWLMSFLTIVFGAVLVAGCALIAWFKAGRGNSRRCHPFR